jgi:hypothetical protein
MALAMALRSGMTAPGEGENINFPGTGHARQALVTKTSIL